MFKFIFSRLFFCITVIAAICAAIIFLCLYLHSLLPAAVGAAAIYALSLLLAAFIVCRDVPSEFKCAHLALIAAIPPVGALIYLLSLPDSSKCVRCCPPVFPSAYNESEYFDDGDAYFNAFFAALDKAEREIFLEFYIVSSGDIWGATCQRLEKALERGVEVRIVYDGFGSALRAPKAQLKALAAKGASVLEFNRPRPFPIARLNRRDHRKIAVIDGRKIFLGGINLADEYAHVTVTHGFWKDGGVALDGEIAGYFRALILQRFGISENVKAEERGACHAFAVADCPLCPRPNCEELLCAAVYAAKREVLITTPYFCVGDKLKDALFYAVRRGVEVKIIVPKVPDKRLTYEITLAFCADAAKRGVQVYRYSPGFIHTKTVICDDGALIGSYNFDFRSLHLNYECGVFVSGELAASARRDFYSAIAVSEQLGLKKPFLLRRALRCALKLFSPLV